MAPTSNFVCDECGYSTKIMNKLMEHVKNRPEFSFDALFSCGALSLHCLLSSSDALLMQQMASFIYNL